MQWRVYFRQSPHVGPLFQRIEKQPGWVTRTAFIAMALAVVIPVVMIATVALAVGLVVFIVLGAIASVISTIKGAWRAVFTRDGRKNVRVVERE